MMMKNWYKRHFLFAEFAASVAMAATAVCAIELLGGRQPLMDTLRGVRASVYSTIASLAGSLLGFVLAAVSIIMIFGQMPRMKLVKDSGQYVTIFNVYFQSILWLAVATMWAVVGLLLDTDAVPRRWITYAMLWLVILVIVRMYRCVWVLQEVTKIGALKTK
jgi:hypothetical protein